MGRTQKLFPRKSKSGRRSFQDIEKLGLPVGDGGGVSAFPRKMINCTPNRGENAFILSKKIYPPPRLSASFAIFFSLPFFLSSFFFPAFLFNRHLFRDRGGRSLFKNWPAIIHSPFSVYQRRSSFLIIPPDNRV